jgi:alpha-tubulin suppressor-like RCC1 family protein
LAALVGIALVGGPLQGVPAHASTTPTAVWAWGFNQSGEMGNGSTATTFPTPAKVVAPAGVSFTSISAGVFDFGTALDANGNAWSWGSNGSGQLGTGSCCVGRVVPGAVSMPTGITFTQISSGRDFVVALDTNGKAWSWGSNDSGELGNGTCCGKSNKPVPVTMPSGITFTQVAAGYSYVLALAANGTVWSSGSVTRPSRSPRSRRTSLSG